MALLALLISLDIPADKVPRLDDVRQIPRYDIETSQGETQRVGAPLSPWT